MKIARLEVVGLVPRRKSAQNCTVLPWLSAKCDGREGRFIQCGNSLFLSKPIQSLSPGARWLYLSMALEAGGKRTFTFKHSSAKKYGVPPSSYDRFLKELKDGGFIEKIEDENMAQYAPGQYRFVFDWKGVSSKPAPQIGDGTRLNLPHSGEGGR